MRSISTYSGYFVDSCFKRVVHVFCILAIFMTRISSQAINQVGNNIEFGQKYEKMF